MAYSRKKIKSRRFISSRSRPKGKPVIKPQSQREYPTSPIQVEKGNTIQDAVEFNSFRETQTPYDALVDIIESVEGAGEGDTDFSVNETLRYGAGALSRTGDGELVSTTAAQTRNRMGVLISDQSNQEHYIVANIKHIFQAKSYIKQVDTSISQLRRMPKEVTGPTNIPVIDTIQCYPGFGTLDGEYSDGFSIQILPEIGEPSLQIAANHTVVLAARGFNYRNELGQKIRDGLSWTWRFTADGMGRSQNQVVGTTSTLRLRNAQLQHRGRYTLEVSNEVGTAFSKSYFVNILGGLLNELEAQEVGENTVYVPTGNYVRDEMHDAEVSKFDTYFDYIEGDSRWAQLEWVNGSWMEIEGAIQSVFAESETVNVRKIDGGISSAEKLTKTFGGRYWRKTPMDPHVYFDSAGGVSYKFASEEEYFNHRRQRGLPSDWSSIDILAGAR